MHVTFHGHATTRGGVGPSTLRSALSECPRRRYVNRRKLAGRTFTTVVMAVIFGAVACLVFLMLQPVINSRLNPVEEPAEISLTEEVVSAEEEISPEDMIADDQEIQAAAAEEIAANSVDAITQEVLDEVQKQLEEEACDMLRFLRVIEAYFSTLPPVCLLSAYVLIIKRMIETAH